MKDLVLRVFILLSPPLMRKPLAEAILASRRKLSITISAM
ncbi:unnamed protein product [Cylicostephanus goldi]|uniref:Uncharacterized protein n=1 Tax=Cylicostephanus goldi TaxID=71465 RepID=A0A3P6SLT4_CYLGO|nr:unnamed protein product [Cylicostephanus goldi]